MFLNYLKIGFRNLKRNQVYALINVLGLSLGIMVFLFIMEFVAAEWSANRFHKHFDDLYRVSVLDKNDQQETYLAPGWASQIEKNFSEVDKTVLVAESLGNGVFSYQASAAREPAVISEPAVFYANKNFFETFSFRILNGNADLTEPATMAISESIALKLFGTVAATGKTVKVSNQFGTVPYRVTGVYEQMPEQSDLQANIILSFSTLESPAKRNGNDWADPTGTSSAFCQIYLQLNPSVNSDKFEADLTSFVKKADPDFEENRLYLQPCRHLHLAPSLDFPYQTFGSLSLVLSLLGIAILILALAWLNYINLSTAQSLKRANETGVRKTLGASRTQLATQFLCETLLMSVMATAIALLAVFILQPFFNQFTGRTYSLRLLNVSYFWILFVFVILLCTVLAGSYVAFLLSSFKPAAILKGKSMKLAGSGARRTLVVIQFCISIVFIIATVTLYQQLRFMEMKQQNINMSQLLVIKGPSVQDEAQRTRNEAFRNEIANLPFVSKYSFSNNIPGLGYNFNTSHITGPNPGLKDEQKEYSMFMCDEQFFDTYGIPFVQGSSFTRSDAEAGYSKAGKVIINEKAAAELGFNLEEDLVGKKIVWGESSFRIAGVIKNYNHLSMRQPVDPMILLPTNAFVNLTIKTDRVGMEQKLGIIKEKYSELFPGNPFEYLFVDETYNKQYRHEQELGKAFIAAAAIAIFIASKGLFGLAAYAAQQRRKEIGIRKVLGANRGQLVRLLSIDFVKLVILSALVAFPVAGWIMYNWLQDFAYRISLQPWIFIGAALLAIVIALLTVSVSALKASSVNPVDTLSAE